MPLTSIKKLLKRKIGLNPSSVGDFSIDRAVKHRLAALTIESIDQYYEILLGDGTELAELVEEVVVPETWFYRNNTPFEAFGKFISKSIVPHLKKDEVVRVLSIPCSSGEEPYSAAISLHLAGVPMNKVCIDAVDISKRAITRAKRAIYGKNSFRGPDESIQNSYFVKGGAGFKLNDEIRNVVNFKLGNFLINPLSPEPDYYHAIFCRNLLIYFDRETQQSALLKLHWALKERGALFVGHAETSQVSREMFVPLYSARSFGYVKVNETENRKSRRKDTTPAKIPDRWQTVFEQLAKISLNNAKSRASVLTHKNNTALDRIDASKQAEIVLPKISLISVERLARQEKYAEAIDLCRQFLKQTVDSADGYFQLGRVLDLDGQNQEADKMIRKAIYLDPNHEKALKLAALLAEKRGDIDAALSYKRRIKRVTNRKPGKSSVA